MYKHTRRHKQQTSIQKELTLGKSFLSQKDALTQKFPANK